MCLQGNDYTDRKAKKKNQKRGRQALGREGSAKERKAGKISRKLKGACFKLPEITDADKNWRDGSDGSDGDAAADEVSWSLLYKDMLLVGVCNAISDALMPVMFKQGVHTVQHCLTVSLFYEFDCHSTSKVQHTLA